ncbi:MAG: serine hydrolase, partial [Cytophagaceae bacterium]|nr:serine hydrolase [Cytophagaceae bacterium]
MLKKRLSIFFLIFTVIFLLSWKKAPKDSAILNQELWVDSVFQSLSPEQKIGQLFMVAAYSNRGESHTQEIENLVKNYHIGGLIFFQGGPVRQANLTNRYQTAAKVPLLIAMDAEWGIGMRLPDSTMSYPRQMTLGAIQEEQLIYDMGAQIAKECRRLGVHVNFAPVVDVNSNPNNPVIGVRSFGEDKDNVARKGIAYMKGMQDNGVLANAKHFPGHGDTETDSHLSMPVISHPKERLQSLEFYPFRKIMDEGVMSVMIAHIHLPAYDNTPNMPTTLSKKVVTDLLKKEMKYDGLIFTDALNMRGVSSFYKPGEVDVMALLAGNDVLLYSENVPLAIKKIQKAIKDKDISQAEIDQKVKKILSAKYFVGLNQNKLVDVNNLYQDLNTIEGKVLQRRLFEKAITVVNNKDSLLPFRNIDTTSFASVSLGVKEENAFQAALSNYAPFTHYLADKTADENYYKQLLEKLKQHEVIVVSLHGMSMYNNTTYGIPEPAKQFIYKLKSTDKKVVLTVFGNPYSLKFFTDIPNLVCAYEDNFVTTKIVPEILFGANTANGKLPVSVSPDVRVGQGIELKNPLYRLRYNVPEVAGMDGFVLKRIDSIVKQAIEDKAMPGCQVLVARNGIVVYNKSFGHLTYDKTQPVTSNTVYDIASITKVAGTLQAVMFLAERGMIDLDKKASYYLPELKNTNKENLQLRDILTHQAGLIPFIPYWKKTIKDTLGFDTLFYSKNKTNIYCNEVIPGVYSIASMEDSLWKWTIESELLKKNRKTKKYDYQYSDLGFYIMKRIVEGQINQPIDQFLQQNFYTPLGLQNMTYKPLLKVPVDRIAPTEDDKLFRKQLVRGCVHDPGAAMFGGVAGHAGLFSNANDVAIIMQMLLNEGTYGGKR